MSESSPSSTGDTPLDARLDRLESIHSIRQLAERYAIAIDARAIDLVVELYVDDVRVGSQRGRRALAAVFDDVLRRFTTSLHQTLGHVIDFDDTDNARGIITCRADHEVGGKWVTIVQHYHDRYQRRDGQWYIRSRAQARLYATAQDDPPVGERKMRWPGAQPSEGNFHDCYPSWREFWQGPVVEPASASRPDAGRSFIMRLRRTLSLPPSPPPFM